MLPVIAQNREVTKFGTGSVVVLRNDCAGSVLAAAAINPIKSKRGKKLKRDKDGECAVFIGAGK